MDDEWIDCPLDSKEEEGWEYEYYEEDEDYKFKYYQKDKLQETKNIENNNVSYINKTTGKLVVNSKFPLINIEYIKSKCEESNIKFKILNKRLTQHKLRYTKKPTIFYMLFKEPKSKQKYYHMVFYDEEKIWDSWSSDYNKNSGLSKHDDGYFECNQHKYYYDKKIYKNSNFFEDMSPQQNINEGYCALFSLANARLRVKGEKLETMNKMLQAQKMRDELATFVEINGEMHVNGIKIFPNV